METDPRASDVTQTQQWAKNENGLFGISASRGFTKVIICHIFVSRQLSPSVALQFTGGGLSWARAGSNPLALTLSLRKSVQDLKGLLP